MFRLACKVLRSPAFLSYVLILSGQLKYRDLMDLVTIEIVSSLTPENVVEQMFYGSPPYGPFLADIYHVLTIGGLVQPMRSTEG